MKNLSKEQDELLRLLQSIPPDLSKIREYLMDIYSEAEDYHLAETVASMQARISL